jgi:hypothetical protein
MTSMNVKCNIQNHNKLLLLIFIALLEGCLTAGTHGSIKSYGFNTNKYALQKAVESVISKNKLIRLDTIKNYMIDETNGRNDTIFDNRYNDTDNYVTFYIKVSGGNNEYTVHYGGDKEYWDTAKSSDLSIAYAFDQNRSGGSDGDGGVKWYNWGLKKRLLRPFEKEFISNVEKELHLKYFDPD